MNSGDRIRRSNFQLEGQFLGTVPDKRGNLKYLKLSTPSGVYWIKLAKPLRRSPWVAALEHGSQVRVVGRQKLDIQKGKIKLKAFEIEAIPAAAKLSAPATKTEKPTTMQMLICTKSSCQKRGAGAICAALQQGLSQRNLTEQVQIVKTGCMKACKAGPHIVVKPDRTRYPHSHLVNVDAILDRHFSDHLPNRIPLQNRR